MQNNSRTIRYIGLSIILLSVTILLGERIVAVGLQARETKNDKNIVEMTDDMRYKPKSVSILVGEQVTWKNVSRVPHTVTADPTAAMNKKDVILPEGAIPFDSGTIDPGDMFSYTFSVPGKYRYFCIPHESMGMIGEVIVTLPGENK